MAVQGGISGFIVSLPSAVAVSLRRQTCHVLHTGPARTDASTPKEHGINSATQAGVLEFSRTTNLPLHGVTVIRNGSLVLDTYFHPC
jgi:hypothetical protein